MKTQPIDQFAAHLSHEVHTSVRDSSVKRTAQRKDALWKDFEDPNALRRLAGQIKQHTLDHLDTYIEKAESALKANGAQVHFAADAEHAQKLILELLHKRNATRVVKTKSMATEEIHLGPFLEKNGVESFETDLGEFIVQIDNDHPSHIVTPIIHKNRKQIARSFEKFGIPLPNDDPESITKAARIFMRQKYLDADVAITGANFLSAESGKIVLVTNEGNARFCLAGGSMHIALVGIEKVVPKDRDLTVFLNLLARSATGQQLTVYTEFIGGPKGATQPDGPQEMHVIFLDNGRTEVLESDCREILRCIRCGACLNVCPVYRQASGHAYRSVYPGPLGAVLSPALAGSHFAALADLPKASSLCGACNEVCPVDIPIPDLLLRLRNRAKEERLPSPGTPPLGGWALLATRPFVWRMAMLSTQLLNLLPLHHLPLPGLKSWTDRRTLPEWRGGEFRKWMKARKGKSND
ncbi:MAG: LutB/LldF family L-lactate oxidation iron-sulfur protein [Chthoniobacterales bacterium]